MFQHVSLGQLGPKLERFERPRFFLQAKVYECQHQFAPHPAAGGSSRTPRSYHLELQERHPDAWLKPSLRHVSFLIRLPQGIQEETSPQCLGSTFSWWLISTPFKHLVGGVVFCYSLGVACPSVRSLIALFSRGQFSSVCGAGFFQTKAGHQ